MKLFEISRTVKRSPTKQQSLFDPEEESKVLGGLTRDAALKIRKDLVQKIKPLVSKFKKEKINIVTSSNRDRFGDVLSSHAISIGTDRFATGITSASRPEVKSGIRSKEDFEAGVKPLIEIFKKTVNIMKGRLKEKPKIKRGKRIDKVSFGKHIRIEIDKDFPSITIDIEQTI